MSLNKHKQEVCVLTKKRKEVLDFITTFSESNGYSPSLQEIGSALDLKSPSTVHFHIKNLEQSGYLIKNDGVTRGLEITGHLNANSTDGRSLYSSDDVPSNKIILGDVIQELVRLPHDYYDAIIIDPPYNIGKDFGNNTDTRDMIDYIQWSKKWLDESIRVLKPGGTMFVYGFSEILAHLSVEIDLPKRWLIWHYTNKNVASLNFWQRSHEAIICSWKEKPLFNRDAVREPYTDTFLRNAAGKPRKSTPGRFSSGDKETTYNAHSLGALPRDVIKVPALAGGAGLAERWFLCRDCAGVFEPQTLKQHAEHDVIKHPTQKPLGLTRKLLKSMKPISGGKVLVPFAGSGSECVVAKQLGLDYLGMELNPEYIQLANGWLNRTSVQSSML